jgi:hypothetical protein
MHIICSGKLRTQLKGVEWPKCAENSSVNCTLYGIYTVTAFRTVDLSAINWTQETNYDNKKNEQVHMNMYDSFQINQPTRCNNFSSLLLDVYVQLNMFRASSRPSSGAQQLQ